jgi:hypothetical protein
LEKLLQSTGTTFTPSIHAEELAMLEMIDKWFDEMFDEQWISRWLIDGL